MRQVRDITFIGFEKIKGGYTVMVRYNDINGNEHGRVTDIIGKYKPVAIMQLNVMSLQFVTWPEMKIEVETLDSPVFEGHKTTLERCDTCKDMVPALKNHTCTICGTLTRVPWERQKREPEHRSMFCPVKTSCPESTPCKEVCKILETKGEVD